MVRFFSEGMAWSRECVMVVRNTLGDISYMYVCHAYVLLFPLLE